MTPIIKRTLGTKITKIYIKNYANKWSKDTSIKIKIKSGLKTLVKNSKIEIIDKFYVKKSYYFYCFNVLNAQLF